MRNTKKTKKEDSKSKALFTEEATLKKLQSFLTDPYFQVWSTSGAAAGIRRKVLSIDYVVLRNIVERVPLFNAVINTRIGQIMPYCRRSTDADARGFKIVNVKDSKKGENNKKEDPNIDILCNFFEQTGFLYDPDREDDLSDYAQMFIRDTIEIDQIATEIQLNKLGEGSAFWALDGATVQRVDPEKSSFDEDVRFVQLINMKVENTYTNKTMIFDYMNKRSDIKHRGFGYSIVEQVIDIATTLLFGYGYVRDQLVKDRVPKGFISVMGDIDGTQIESIKRYWYAAMSGAGGQWSIPILPSGKDGIGMDFKTLGSSNKDMEYHKTMMFLSSIVAAVANIDLAEMGIKADDSQALIGDDSDARMKASKDRGLGALLAFFEQHLNKILRKITDEYQLKIVGFEVENKKQDADVAKSEIEAYKSIDEVREEKGKKPFNEEWSKMPLNPQAVQMKLQQISQEQQEKMQQQQMSAGGSEGGFGDENPEDANSPYGSDSGSFNEDMFKSLTNKKVKHFIIR